jgi:hypothetical protein
MAEYKFLEERTAAEKRFPFIRQFRDKVNIAPTKTENKGGYGEYVEADSPDNPMPGKPTITIGRNSGRLEGGVADTIINDMVHAAREFSPDFKKLQKEVVNNLSGNSLALAKRRYENDFKGKFSGSNFSTFDNFLKGYWADGIVQHLLLPENSEIDQIKRSSPKAIPALNAIEELFKTGVPPGKIIGDVLDE